MVIDQAHGDNADSVGRLARFELSCLFDEAFDIDAFAQMPVQIAEIVVVPGRMLKLSSSDCICVLCRIDGSAIGLAISKASMRLRLRGRCEICTR